MNDTRSQDNSFLSTPYNNNMFRFLGILVWSAMFDRGTLYFLVILTYFLLGQDCTVVH